MIHFVDKSNALFDDENDHQAVVGGGANNASDANTSDKPNNTVDLINIIGLSEAINKVRHLIMLHSRYDAPVLVTGETGTGKELAARGLHYSGARAPMAFIAINCATLTDDLFASELFGHVKGAFTDAKKDKKGLLAVAEKGTLFLDEVDSLSLKSQAALLRFLQEGEYRPVGSSVTYQSNIRLIASANCDLGERIQSGLFRADLYYRLYILSVHMPPLRHRTGDIPVLAKHFIEKFDYQYGLGIKSITPELLFALERRPWLGNVRELENLIHRLYLCSMDDYIGIDMLGFEVSAVDNVNEHIKNATHQQPDPQATLDNLCPSILGFESFESFENYDFARDKKVAVEFFEKCYVEKIMHKSQGNVTLAAKICGKERRAFGKLVKKYHIKKTCLDVDDE